MIYTCNCLVLHCTAFAMHCWKKMKRRGNDVFHKMKSNRAIVQQSIRNHFRRPRGRDASAVTCTYSYRVNKSAQWASTREKPRDIASSSKAKPMEVLLSIQLLYLAKTFFSQHATNTGGKETKQKSLEILQARQKQSPWRLSYPYSCYISVKHCLASMEQKQYERNLHTIVQSRLLATFKPNALAR